MANEIRDIKEAILTWTYNQLSTKYPDYFKIETYTSTITNRKKTAPNVYWINTITDRPELATECYLDIGSDQSVNKGTDGEFYYNSTDQKYYNKIEETHILTVYFIISSMRREDKGGSITLSDVQAQNLVLDACSYLRRMLKSQYAGNYFLYDNELFTPIFVLAQQKDISDIEDTSSFEETRNRHTCQFSCKFSFTITDSVEAQLADGAHIIIDDETAQDITFDISEQD